MATRTARSTPRQREALGQLAVDLIVTRDSIDGRYWASRDERAALETVINFLTRWVEWEEQDD